MPIVAANLIPTSVSSSIIEGLTDTSVVLGLARRQPMPTASTTIPVIKTLPVSGWVNGTGGRKPATAVEWSSEVITAEEVAAVVAVPLALLDDAGIPIWTEIRALLTEALAYSIDSAILFGTNAPPSFIVGGIVTGAPVFGVEAPAVVGGDLAGAVSAAMGAVEAEGLLPTGHASDVRLRAALRNLRDANGVPIFAPSLTAGAPSVLWGLPIRFSTSGAFVPARADLITGDWTKLVVGVRQDMTWGESDDAVITDGAGAVLVNAFQDNQRIMRVSMRLGYVVGKPVTRMAGGAASPFAVVRNTDVTGP